MIKEDRLLRAALLREMNQAEEGSKAQVSGIVCPLYCLLL